MDGLGQEPAVDHLDQTVVIAAAYAFPWISFACSSARRSRSNNFISLAVWGGLPGLWLLSTSAFLT
jgi:hypothetical protein